MSSQGFPSRIARAWRAMASEQRLAGLAAIGLLVTMFFPWYGLQSVDPKTRAIHSRSINAFGDISFVEAAVFLVAAGVIVLLFARAERRAFHLPGGDGTIVTAAGAWAALLIFYRVFDRPDGGGYPVGIEWGFFLAFVASGALAYAGWRIRQAHRPEPPLPGEEPTSAVPPESARTDVAPPRPRRRQPPPDDQLDGQLTFDEHS
jgi:hypothetical protein